jgi:hypothetical protein
LALAAGCPRPGGPSAGGRLTGTLVTDPVADWSFANAYPWAEVEARPDRPVSVTMRFYVAGGQLYLDLAKRRFARWRDLVREDPRVRVRFGDRVYELLAVAVSDRGEIGEILPVYYAKDGGTVPEGCAPPYTGPGCEIPDVAFVRLEPRR